MVLPAWSDRKEPPKVPNTLVRPSHKNSEKQEKILKIIADLLKGEMLIYNIKQLSLVAFPNCFTALVHKYGRELDLLLFRPTFYYQYLHGLILYYARCPSFTGTVLCIKLDVKYDAVWNTILYFWAHCHVLSTIEKCVNEGDHRGNIPWMTLCSSLMQTKCMKCRSSVMALDSIAILRKKKKIQCQQFLFKKCTDFKDRNISSQLLFTPEPSLNVITATDVFIDTTHQS